MSQWEAIVREEGPAVFRIAWRILRNAADAEDVSQEVLMELFRLTEAGKVQECKGLLRRLAVFRSLDRLRQRRPTGSIDDFEPPTAGPSPEQHAMANELAEQLLHSLGRLPQQAAAVFCLRYFENLTHAEIAKSLDISPTTVSSALHKARTRLSELLGNVVKEK